MNEDLYVDITCMNNHVEFMVQTLGWENWFKNLEYCLCITLNPYKFIHSKHSSFSYSTLCSHLSIDIRNTGWSVPWAELDKWCNIGQLPIFDVMPHWNVIWSTGTGSKQSVFNIVSVQIDQQTMKKTQANWQHQIQLWGLQIWKQIHMKLGNRWVIFHCLWNMEF